MYQQFYGLNALPFELTATPGCLFSSPGQREALSNLVYGLSTAKAITLLTGEAGTGKTTLIQAAIGSKRCKHVSCVYLHNPALTRAEFFEMLARQFGLDASLATSKTILLARLETALLNRRARGQAVALVVDEAQCLSHELLEEIRLLANFEVESQRLIPVVLAGQPELADRLNEPSLRQLKQRIALRCTVEPFSLPETAAYMSTRIKFAGGEGARLFTREAVVLVHERSRGIARTINVICDNALLTGMALGRRPVGHEIVMEVCEDFDLRRAGDMPRAGTGPGVRRDETAPVEAAAERGVAAARVNAATPSL
jgi:general secretion pathway protein A